MKHNHVCTISLFICFFLVLLLAKKTKQKTNTFFSGMGNLGNYLNGNAIHRINTRAPTTLFASAFFRDGNQAFLHIRVAHVSKQRTSYFTNFAPMHFVVEVKFRTMFRNVLLACLFVQVAKAAKGWLDWLIAMHTAHDKCKYRSPKRSAHFLEYICCGLGSLVNTWLFQMLYVLGRFSLFHYRHIL